jgi:PhnB protein
VAGRRRAAAEPAAEAAACRSRILRSGLEARSFRTSISHTLPAKPERARTTEGTMTSSVRPIPEGYHSVTPYLAVDGAARAIEFYKQAFGATEVMRMAAPGGKIGHAEIRIGDSRIMLADEYPDMGFRSPKAYGGSPVGLHLYVEDVDAVARQAVAAGAREVRPVKDQFYGDRTGSFEDPFGHVWHIATRKEELSPDELKRRAVAAMGQQGS